MKKILLSTLASVAMDISEACTNILVTNSASSDGSALLGDNDDTAKRFGAVTHFDAAVWPEGSTRDIYDFETSVYKGVISQPAKTVCALFLIQCV